MIHYSAKTIRRASRSAILVLLVGLILVTYIPARQVQAAVTIPSQEALAVVGTASAAPTTQYVEYTAGEPFVIDEQVPIESGIAMTPAPGQLVTKTVANASGNTNWFDDIWMGWAKDYAGSHGSFTNVRIAADPESGYIIAGGDAWTGSSTGQESILIKTDASGNETWRSDPFEHVMFYDVTALGHEDYVAVGLYWVGSYSGENPNGIVIVHASGTSVISTTKIPATTGIGMPTRVIPASATEVMVGISGWKVTDNDSPAPALMKVSASGGSPTIYKLTGSRTEVWDLVKTTTGYAVLLGYQITSGEVVVLTDTNGNETDTWDVPDTIPSINEENNPVGISISSILQTADGGFILAGTAAERDGDALLLKTEADGTEEWHLTHDYEDDLTGAGSTGEFGRFSVVQTQDGTYVAAGATTLHDSLSHLYVWAVKPVFKEDGTFDDVNSFKWDRSDAEVGDPASYSRIGRGTDIEVKGNGFVIAGPNSSQQQNESKGFLFQGKDAGSIKKQIRVKNIKLYSTLYKPWPLQNEETLLDSPVFIDGISVPITLKALIDWGDDTGGTVKYTVKGVEKTPISSMKVEGQKYTEVTFPALDIRNDFNGGGLVKVKAEATSGSKSKEREFTPIVASPPMGVSRDVIQYMFSWDRYALEYGLGPGGVLGMVSQEFGSFANMPNIPLFKGKNNGLEMMPKVKGKLDLEGSGSMEVGVMLSKGDGQGSSAFGGVKEAIQGVKDAAKAGKKLSKVGQPKVEVSLEITGGVAFEYDTDAGGWKYGGTLGIGFSGYMETAPYYVFVAVGPVVIPFYARAGAGIDVHNQLTAMFVDASGGWSAPWDAECSGEFELDVYGKIMAGVGIADVLSIEVYGKAGVHMKLVYPAPDPKTGKYLTELSIPVEAGITVTAVIWSHSRKFWEYKWVLLDDPYEGTGDPGEFTPLSRDYLNGDEAYALFHPQTINPVNVEKALQTNVYPYSQPAIVSHDGKVFGFWIYDDPARSDNNRTKLVYSQLIEGMWGTPRAVWDDGTLDQNPEAVFLPDGRVLVAWENVKTQLLDTDGLEQALQSMEIAYAVYDPATDTWQRTNLTGDEYFDHSPKLSAAEDGSALLTWTKNRSNALLASPDKPDTLAYALWNGSSWSTPTGIPTSSKSVTKSSLAYNGTTGHLVWEGDEDTDLSTPGAVTDPVTGLITSVPSDRELRSLQFTRGSGWGAETRLTDNDYLDANPQVLFDNGAPVLFWLKDADGNPATQDGDVVMTRNLTPGLPGATTAVEDILSAGGAGFKAMARPSKGLMLFWSDGSEEGSDIYVARWDRLTELWGERQQLTADDMVERDMAATVLDDNRFVLLYDKDTVTYVPGANMPVYDHEGNIVPDPVPADAGVNLIPQRQKTDLYFMTYEDRVDLLANYIYLDNPRTVAEGIADPTPVPGDTVTLTVEVGNAGDTVEQNIPVEFYQGGKKIGTATVNGYLAPWQVGTASLTYTVPEQKNLLFSAQIDPDYAPDDADRTNDAIMREITTKMLAKPVAGFKYNPTTVRPGQPVTFDASVSYAPNGRITQLTWEFGDDLEGEDVPVNEVVVKENSSIHTIQKTVAHTFETAGEYDVLLKVRDNKALGATVIRTVFVVDDGADPPAQEDLPTNMFEDFIINSGETKTLTEDIFVSGNVKNLGGTLQAGSYNIILVGDGPQQIEGVLTTGKFVHSGSGTVQLTDDATVGEFLNMTGSFDPGGNNLTVNGPATLGGGTFQSGSGNLNFNDGLTISDGTFNGSNGMQVNGNLTLSGGTLNASDSLYVSGNWLHSEGTFSNNGGTVVFDGVEGQLITGSNTFNNLTIDNDSTDMVDASGSTLVVLNDLTIINGAFKSASDYADVIILDGATLALADDITVSGNFTNNGIFTSNGFKVTFDGATTQNLNAAAGHAITFADLEITAGTILVDTVPGDSATYSGTLTNNGTIRKTQSGADLVMEFNTFGLTEAKINVTTMGTLTGLQVDRVDGVNPNLHTDGLNLEKYWTITPTGSDYTVDLTLPVSTSPYAGFNHTRARVFRYDGGVTWDGARTNSSLFERIPGRSADTSGSPYFGPVVTRTGITALSSWTVGDPEIDLAVADSPDPVVVGETLTYTLTATNVTGSAVSNVTVTNVLPAGVTYQSASVPNGSYNPATGTVTWVSITAGSSETASITVMAPVGATAPLLTNIILNNAEVEYTLGGTTVSHTVTTGTTVINTAPGTSAGTFASSSWFNGIFMIDADAQPDLWSLTPVANDTVYFALTDSDSDGRYDTIDFSMNDASYRDALGDNNNDIISRTLPDDETATTADIMGRALNFGETPARFKLSRLDASPVAAEAESYGVLKHDPLKDAALISPWYTGIMPIDVNGDQIPDDIDFVIVDPGVSDYMYTLVNIDRDDSDIYNTDGSEEHPNMDQADMGGIMTEFRFPITGQSLRFRQGKIVTVVQAGEDRWLISVPKDAGWGDTQDNVRIKVVTPDDVMPGYYWVKGTFRILTLRQ